MKTFYYSDELNDDFAGVVREKKTIADDYCYVNHNPLFRFGAFITYYVIMRPIAYIYCKLKFRLRIVNREILKHKKGFFLYGNHTQLPGDGYFPSLVAYPVKPYVLVNPDSVAIKGTETFMVMIGAMPLPGTASGLKNMWKSIDQRINQGKCIMIYPEAHIWPYYTGIRPFKNTSFRFPVKAKAPSYCFTVTYYQRKNGKPGITVYVDGPFDPDESLSLKEQQQMLRDSVYECMCERAQNSSYQHILYKKQDQKKETEAENQ